MADLNPADAEALDLQQGNEMEVYTDFGCISLKANLTHMADAGTVYIYPVGSGERGSLFRLSGLSQQPGGHTKEGAVNERENHPVRPEQMHGLLCLRHGLHG